MAAPRFVPVPADDAPRVYASPPRDPATWMADRPAEIIGGQPLGDRLGAPGPDQGYALKLAESVRGTLNLTVGESEDDALAGCSAIAMRRASSFGRGPIIHDLTAALTLWGYRGAGTPGLAEIRARVFASVASSHHYVERRALVDAIPADVLAMGPDAVAALVRDEPSRVLEIARDALAAQSHDDHA